MPGFKSVAHREKLRKLMDEGSFPRQDFEALDRETSGDLPERLTPGGAPRPVRLSTGGSSRYTRAAKQKLY